jgi:hypothetical protein
MCSNPNNISEIPVFEKQMIRMIAACTRPARPAGAVPRPSPRAASLDPPAAITTWFNQSPALRLKTRRFMAALGPEADEAEGRS